MNDVKIISGANEEAIWSQISSDLASDDILEYDIIIDQNNRQIELMIDIDLGGGFEGGYEITSLTSLLTVPNDFRFAIHKESFLDEIGKFFGMQDVELGFPEFDKKVIVKTNDDAKVKTIFSDPGLRSFFKSLDSDYTLGIVISHHEKKLEFTIEKGITDAAVLQTIYHNFLTVLELVDAP